jgi:cell division protein FtsI (penicillin-binding protein 3)
VIGSSKKEEMATAMLCFAKNVSIRDLEQIKTFPIFRLGKNKGGLIIDRQHVRVKPYRLLASRTLGLDRDNAQPIGLERTFDDYLKGEEGQRLVQRVTGRSMDTCSGSFRPGR